MQNMKKNLTVLTLLLALGWGTAKAQISVNAMADSVAQKVEALATESQKMADSLAQQAEALSEVVVAYSDTTGAEAGRDTAYITITRGGKTVQVGIPSGLIDDEDFDFDGNDHDFSGLKQNLSYLKTFLHHGIWDVDSQFRDALAFGTILSIFAIIFLVFLLPILVIALVARHMIKNHNRNARRENELDAARSANAPLVNQPTTEEEARWEIYQSLDSTSQPPISEADLQWKRGVRNLCIGAGLTIFFSTLGLDGLKGLGILIAILGLGQMLIAKTSK